MLFHYFFSSYTYLYFTLSIIFTYFRYYDICNIKITSQCKIFIVPEEGWFGQPKYNTPTKNHSKLCRLLLLLSSLYTWSRLDHYWSHVHLRDHQSGCLLKRFIVLMFLFLPVKEKQHFIGKVARFKLCQLLLTEHVPCNQNLTNELKSGAQAYWLNGS